MIKRIAFGTLALLVSLIFLAIVAPLFISGETYKAQIKSAVEAATGRTFTIEGKLSVQFFPTAGIIAEKVTLSNPKGFDDKKPFMSLSSLNIEVATMPLLSGNVVIKNFVLQDPLIHMQASLDGKKNWEFKAKRYPTSDDDSSDATPPDRPVITNPKILPHSLMLKNFEIKNGTILYTKGCCESVFELKKLNTTVVLQSTASAASLNGNAEWNGKQIDIKAGIGTLESLINEQKMEIKLSLKNDLFSLSVDGNYEKGGFSGKEISDIGSIKELMKWIAPAKPLETDAKLAFKSESELRCGTSYCSFANINFSLDSLNAKGSIKAQFSDVKPMLDINLSIAQLDLNPFLSELHNKSTSQNPFISDAIAQVQNRWSEAPIDLSALNSVNATVVLNAQNITFKKLVIDKLILNSKLQQGQLTIDANNIALYKGSGTALAKISANQVPPMFESGLVLKGVELEPLLKDVTDKDSISGYGDFQLNLKSTGRSVKAMVEQLSGEGQIRIAKGEIKHMNLTDMLHNVAGSFTGNGDSQSSTYFTELSASYNITQGVITNRDLNMQVKDLNVSGEGNVSLPAYTINYHLVPKILRTTQDANGVTTVKQGLAVPLLIEGSLDNPQFKPDLAAAAQQALQDPKQLKEQLRNSREVLKEQIKDPKEAVKNLKGLLKGFGGR